MNQRFTDLHVHSEYSSCAEDVTVAGWADIARTTDNVFALTDHSAHIFFPPDHKWGLWTDQAVELFEANIEAGQRRIRDYLDYVRGLRCGGMLVGVELDIMPDGRPVYPAELLGGLDLVLGAVHAMPTLRHKRPLDEVEDEFRFQVQVFAGMGVDALAHPFRLMLGADYPVSDELVRWTVEVAVQSGMALEINSHKRYPDHDVAMVRAALDCDAHLIVGSDAHRWDEFGDFAYHVDILQQAGVGPEALDELLWLPETAAPGPGRSLRPAAAG